MPATARSPQSRPHSAPGYYPARLASAWITALHRSPPADRREVPRLFTAAAGGAEG